MNTPPHSDRSFINRRQFVLMAGSSILFPGCAQQQGSGRPQLFPYGRYESWQLRLTEGIDFKGFDMDLEKPLSHLMDEFAKMELLTQAGPEVAERERYVVPPVTSGVQAAAQSSNRWRPAGSLLKLREQINVLAPRRSKRDDGMIGDAAHQSRASDHNPWVRDGSTGVVTAFDVTHHPAGGCNCNALVNSLVASRDTRIKYIIWNRRIINRDRVGSAAPWTWRPYRGKNPHSAHMHLSVLPTKSLYDDKRAWSIRVA